MAPRAPLPPAGECLGGLSVGAGQQPLASVRPGQIHVTIHVTIHTHTHIHTHTLRPPGRLVYGALHFYRHYKRFRMLSTWVRHVTPFR